MRWPSGRSITPHRRNAFRHKGVRTTEKTKELRASQRREYTVTHRFVVAGVGLRNSDSWRWEERVWIVDCRFSIVARNFQFPLSKGGGVKRQGVVIHASLRFRDNPLKAPPSFPLLLTTSIPPSPMTVSGETLQPESPLSKRASPQMFLPTS